jgi:quinoprotein dehydrogenase-associated probable ABC transporter substrate-binding protein
MRQWLLAAGFFLTVAIPSGYAQQPGLGASVELVDPKVLRVCADPRDMPYSDQAGEGFENKIAELFGKKLGKPVAYTWFPQVIGFVRNTLGSYRCDVVMGVAQGYDLVQNTNPYYHTAYVLFFKPGTGLDGVTTLEDPRLKNKRIGVVADTPPASLMVRDGLMAKAHPYPLTIDTRFDSSAKAMMDDLVKGDIDAGVLWGPLAGYYAKNAGVPVTVVPLLKEPKPPPMDFHIVMGVRRSDQDWKRTLNKLIAENKDEIDKLLADYGVPLLDEQGNLISK